MYNKSNYKPRRKQNISGFKPTVKAVNELLKKYYNISLSFKGYDLTMRNIKNLATEDLDGIMKVVNESNLWLNYLTDIKGIIDYHLGLFELKRDLIKSMIDLNDYDIKHDLNGEESTLYPYKKKYKIESSHNSDIYSELLTKLEFAEDDLKLFRKLSKILESRIKYFDSLSFSLLQEYNTQMNKRYFKGGIY